MNLDFTSFLEDQIGGLLVVGDIDTLAPSARVNKPKPEEGEEGEVVAVKSDTFLAFMDYFRRQNRVATVNANPYRTADNKDYGWSKGEDDGGGWGNNCGEGRVLDKPAAR